MGSLDSASRERRQRLRKQRPAITSDCCRPCGARLLWWLTQGSQSLALGLTLTAATQLFSPRLATVFAVTKTAPSLLEPKPDTQAASSKLTPFKAGGQTFPASR